MKCVNAGSLWSSVDIYILIPKCRLSYRISFLVILPLACPRSRGEDVHLRVGPHLWVTGTLNDLTEVMDHPHSHAYRIVASPSEAQMNSHTTTSLINLRLFSLHPKGAEWQEHLHKSICSALLWVLRALCKWREGWEWGSKKITEVDK